MQVPLGVPLPAQHSMDMVSFTDAMNRLSLIETQQRHQEDRILQQQHVLNTLQQIQQQQNLLSRERAPENMWAGNELEKHVGDKDRSMIARRLKQRPTPQAKEKSDVDPWREYMLRGTGSIP
jgi:hypothetical protein